MSRVFLALKAPASLQKEMSHMRKAYLALPVRWILSKDLHVTIVAPWESENIEEVKKLMDSLAGKHGEVALKFTKISFGPNQNAPRLIWASGKTPLKLTQIKNTFEKAFAKKDKFRRFKLHLTLARFKSADFPKFPIKKLDENVNLRVVFDKITLFESSSSDFGSTYNVLYEALL